MSTVQTWQTACTSLSDSLRLAEAVGRELRGGEVIELVSDLGGGKTTLVRGLVKGAGSRDKVSSPSFTLSNQYQLGDLTLYHFDFYRLKEAGIMADELAELLNDPEVVIVVEWADIIEDALPTDRLTITIRASGESSREFDFIYPKNLDYLVPINT